MDLHIIGADHRHARQLINSQQSDANLTKPCKTHGRYLESVKIPDTDPRFVLSTDLATNLLQHHEDDIMQVKPGHV